MVRPDLDLNCLQRLLIDDTRKKTLVGKTVHVFLTVSQWIVYWDNVTIIILSGSLFQLSLDMHYTEDEIYELSLAREPRNSLSSVSSILFNSYLKKESCNLDTQTTNNSGSEFSFKHV